MQELYFRKRQLNLEKCIDNFRIQIYNLDMISVYGNGGDERNGVSDINWRNRKTRNKEKSNSRKHWNLREIAE